MLTLPTQLPWIVSDHESLGNSPDSSCVTCLWEDALRLCVQEAREPARIGDLPEKEHFARGPLAVF